jgi:hypothetical protein
MHNDDYTVKVRKPGGEWQDLFEYKVQVDMDKPTDASMVYFDFSGTVEVFVRKNNGTLNAVRMRPSLYGTKPIVNGNTITFTLTRPANISVEFNGDKLANLHIFANAVETSRPDSTDTNVIYFGPGIHESRDSVRAYRIPSNKTVYIAGGAIVKYKLICDRVKNVKILGRGLLYQPQEGIQVSYSDSITIDGITVVNPTYYTVRGGESNHIVISNIKSFSSKSWSDGIDLMSCSNVAIDGVFMRNSDDCIAIYGHRWGLLRKCKKLYHYKFCAMGRYCTSH